MHPSSTGGPLICFHVNDMSCAESAAVIVSAIRRIDALASVRVDLSMRYIEVSTPSAKPSDYRDAINRAGFAATWQCPPELADLQADPFFSFSVPIYPSESTHQTS